MPGGAINQPAVSLQLAGDGSVGVITLRCFMWGLVPYVHTTAAWEIYLKGYTSSVSQT